MPKSIFDVVAKDEKEEHVAEDVRDAAMHEHRGEQREVNRNRSRLQTRHFDSLSSKVLHDYRPRSEVPASNNFSGNCRVRVSELFVAAETLQEDKDQHVD